MKKEKLIEYTALIFILLVSLIFASGFVDGKLSHDFPVNFNAADMYTFAAYGEAPKNVNSMYETPNYLKGGLDDALNFYSPISSLIITQISDFSGLEAYDLIIHLNILFLIATGFLMYFMLRPINKYAALLAMPLFLLVFKWPFTFYIHWGGHLGNLNFFLIFISIFALMNLNKKGMFIIFGLINAASFLSHGREFLAANLGFVLFLGIRILKDRILQKLAKKKNILELIKKEISLKYLLNYFYAGLVLLIAIFPWWKVLPAHMSKNTESGGLVLYDYSPNFHQVSFGDFGFYLIPIIIGLCLLSFFIIKKNKLEFDLIFTFTLVCFISGVFTILGNSVPQIRQLWAFALIPALFIFWNLILDFLKSYKIKKIYAVPVILILLLGATYTMHEPERLVNNDQYQDYRMQSFNWMKESSNKDENFLMLFGESYGTHTMFSFGEREFSFIRPNDFIKQIQTGKMTDEFKIHHGLVHWYFKEDEKGSIIIERPFTQPSISSICNYNYIYADISTSNQVLTNIMQLTLVKLVESGTYELAYQNALVMIIKKTEDSCFDEIIYEVAQE